MTRHAKKWDHTGRNTYKFYFPWIWVSRLYLSRKELHAKLQVIFISRLRQNKCQIWQASYTLEVSQKSLSRADNALFSWMRLCLEQKDFLRPSCWTGPSTPEPAQALFFGPSFQHSHYHRPRVCWSGKSEKWASARVAARLQEEPVSLPTVKCASTQSCLPFPHSEGAWISARRFPTPGPFIPLP